MKKTLFFAFALVAGILAFTSCQNDKNDPDVTKPVDDITINPEDWHTVPQSGCTIELDDISLTVPANTFSEDTKLSVTKLKSGNYYAEYEASNFYYITVPAQVNQSITVNLTPSKKGSKVQYAARAPFHRKSTNEDVIGDIELECKYDDNGECTILLPTSENDTEDPNLWIIVGLVEDNSSTPSSKGAAMRKMTDLTLTPAGQVKNVKWHYAMDTWLWLKQSDSEGAKINNLMNKLTPIITDALNKIHELGFALDEERDIPICFIRDEKNIESYGFFCQGFWSDKTSTVELNLSALEKSKDDKVLGKTCIHELLHYFQANYDKRCPEKKYFGGEEDILNEAAAVWVEQFMNDGQLDAKFVGNHINAFISGLQISENGNQPSKQGYGMSSLLYYLTNPIGDMEALGINKNSIVELFRIWKDDPKYRGNSYATLYKWFADHSCYFMTSSYDKFLLSVVTGKVFDLVAAGKGNISGIVETCNITSLNKDRTYTYPTRTCLTHGCAMDQANVNMRESFKGKELIIKQDKPDVETYLVVGDDNYKYDYYKQYASLGKPLVIKGEEIDKMLNGAHKTDFYFVTVNTFGSKKDFSVTCTIQDAEESEVQIKSLYFEAGIEMGIKEEHDGTPIVAIFNEEYISGTIITVNKTATGYTATATLENDGYNNKQSMSLEVNTSGSEPVITQVTFTTNNPEGENLSITLTDVPCTRITNTLQEYVFGAYDSKNTFHVSDFSYYGPKGTFNSIYGNDNRAEVYIRYK